MTETQKAVAAHDFERADDIQENRIAPTRSILPENYRVELSDKNQDAENAEWMAVVSFHERPQFTEDTREDEERAIAEVLQAYGIAMHAETPQSDVSPTGQWFWRAPWFRVYDKFIVVTQSGGLDV